MSVLVFLLWVFAVLGVVQSLAFVGRIASGKVRATPSQALTGLVLVLGESVVVAIAALALAR